MAKVSLTNTYKKYPAYKDSKVEWVGDVPEGWDMATSRRLFKTDKKLASQTNSQKVLSLTLKGVIPRILDGSGKNPANYDTYQEFLKDDLVFCLFDYDVTPRTIGHVPEDGMMTGAYTRLIPKTETVSRFFYYYFLYLDYSKELLHLCTGLRNSISKPLFWSLKSPLPSLEEQEKIAKFLDEQTARIDESISKKQRLIELLKEKRTAVINNAVTKGLDPKVELIDSGVEWIGKIPKGWEVVKMKFLTKKPLQYGINAAAESENIDDVRFIRITDVNADGTLREDTFKSLPLEVAKPYLLNEGDILFARTGATAGKSFMYRKEWGKCCFAGYLIRLSTKEEKVDHNFLNLVTYSDYYLQWTKSVFIQSTIQNISAEKYKEFNVALPPVDIQKRIVDGVKNDLESINFAQVKIKSSIVLLKEFKTSLISHAVTGKIKI